AIKQNRPSRVNNALVAGVIRASWGRTRSDFSSGCFALVASIIVTVTGVPAAGSFAAGTATSLCPPASTIDIEPRVSPTATDERTLPEVTLNEMSDPPVTDATKPTLPLEEIS